jgi:octaprenyl-diphosphate synthase
MTLEQVYEPILRGMGQVDAELRSRTSGRLDVFSSGKRLRPAILLFTAHAFDGVAASEVTLAASAIEMIHTASLIHDDVIDDSPRRRQLPSVFSVIGVKPAIVFADFLFLQGLTMFASVGDPRILPLVVQDVGAMCEGQWLELKVENGRGCTEAEYLDIIGKKTASLFACSARTGGMLRGTADEELAHVEAFGRNFGFVYQLRDDAQDLASSNPGPLERCLIEWGGPDYCRRVAAGYRERAQESASRIQDEIERDNLLRILNCISEV